MTLSKANTQINYSSYQIACQFIFHVDEKNIGNDLCGKNL